MVETRWKTGERWGGKNLKRPRDSIDTVGDGRGFNSNTIIKERVERKAVEGYRGTTVEGIYLLCRVSLKVFVATVK